MLTDCIMNMINDDTTGLIIFGAMIASTVILIVWYMHDKAILFLFCLLQLYHLLLLCVR